MDMFRRLRLRFLCKSFDPFEDVRLILDNAASKAPKNCTAPCYVCPLLFGASTIRLGYRNRGSDFT